MSDETHLTSKNETDPSIHPANLWAQISDCGETEFDLTSSKNTKSQPEQIFGPDEPSGGTLFYRGR